MGADRGDDKEDEDEKSRWERGVGETPEVKTHRLGGKVTQVEDKGGPVRPADGPSASEEKATEAIPGRARPRNNTFEVSVSSRVLCSGRSWRMWGSRKSGVNM